MGLADWDEGDFEKSIKKETSKTSIKKEIIEWIVTNSSNRIYKNKFKFDTTTTPWTIDYDGNIFFKKDATKLTSDLFQWGEVKGNFFCCNCHMLESLEGVTENISGNYYCINNHSLSLKNISDTIKDKVAFNCEKCERYGLVSFLDNTLESKDNILRDILPSPYVRINDKYNCTTSDFVEKVKDVYQEKVMPSIRNMVNSHWLIKYLICIIKNIPIHFEIQEGREYLGLYRNKNNEREIILFEDAIKSEAKGNEEYLDNLIWKVIVHEYAHAVMDAMYNGLNKLQQQDPKLYKCREESLANAFALKVLEKSLGNVWINGGYSALITRWGFDKIKEFVKNQPEEYRHGLDLYQRDDLFKMMEFWRETKIIGNKSF